MAEKCTLQVAGVKNKRSSRLKRFLTTIELLQGMRMDHLKTHIGLIINHINISLFYAPGAVR